MERMSKYTDDFFCKILNFKHGLMNSDQRIPANEETTALVCWLVVMAGVLVRLFSGQDLLSGNFLSKSFCYVNCWLFIR